MKAPHKPTMHRTTMRGWLRFHEVPHNEHVVRQMKALGLWRRGAVTYRQFLIQYEAYLQHLVDIVPPNAKEKE